MKSQSLENILMIILVPMAQNQSLKDKAQFFYFY